MSESKHTPEPWAYYDDRKSTGRIEIVGLGKTVSRIYLSVPDEDVANARRITACVNACAGIDTELLEIIEDNDKTLAGVIANVEKQRDELLDALEDLIDLYDGRKHEGIAIVANARAAIASVKGEQ